MVAEEIISSFDGTKIYMKRNIVDDAKAIAIIVHGLCEHQGRYNYLVELFNKAGISCYRFDHRGHGRSEGERAFFTNYLEPVNDTNTIVDIAINENTGKNCFLVGHSMGGFTCALYGLRYQNKLTGIILSGALTHDNYKSFSSIPEGLDVHDTKPNVLGDGVCSVKEVVEKYNSDIYNTKAYSFGLLYALKEGTAYMRDNFQEFTYPVLMLHGEKDVLVNVKDTFDSFEEAKSVDKQMKIYGGLFHEIFHEYCKNEVINDVINWILNRI